MVYKWKSVVKFGDITTVLHCYNKTGITSVLPLKSTVLPVVIPPNFTADFHWYTTGNTTGKSRDILYGFIYKVDYQKYKHKIVKS